MKRLTDIGCIIIFFLTVGVFFYPTILQRKLPVPSDSLVGLYHPWRDLYSATNPRGVPFKNFLITDPVRQQIPWRKIAIDQWKDRILPRWNSYNFSGTPLAGNIQAAVFYPLNVLFLLFDFPVAWTLLIILQPALAGFFLYGYLRNRHLHPYASLLGAIAWSFSGFAIAWMTWGTIVHVALWLPLVLLSIDKLIEGRPRSQNIVWSLLLAVGLAMQVFAGHIQIALYCMGVVLAYAGYRIWQLRENRRKSMLWIALGIGIFILVAAIQWLPMITLVFESGRIFEAENWVREGWFIPWQNLAQFVAPDFFGNPATLNYWGVWNYGEFIGYIGAVPLLFAFLSVLSKNRGKDIIFWTVSAGLALAFSLPTPIAKFPYLMRLPVLSALQPSRLLVVIDFSLVILAAYGFDLWLRKREGNTKGVIIGIGIIIFALWGIVWSGGEDFLVSKRNLMLPTTLFIFGSFLLLAPRLLKRYKTTYIIGILFITITVFDLWRFGWKFTPFTDREYFFPETQTISFLKQQLKPFRVMSTDKRILPPNVSAYFGIETIEGYDPLILERYEELMAAVGRGKPDIAPPFGFNRIITLESIDSPLLPMLNVRYILSLTDIDRPFFRKVFQEGSTRVYEYTHAMPRAYIADTIFWVKTKQEAIQALFEAPKQANYFAVVESIQKPVESIHQSESGVVTIRSYSSSAISIEADVKQSSFLVLSESYSRLWRLRVDGLDTQIYRTNYGFMGAIVPAGIHRVEFTL